MSCFIVPMAEAAAVAIFRKSSYSANKSLGKLEIMLWGGSFVLFAEHIYHGEFGLNLHEMATNGLAMSVLVTLVWVCLRNKSFKRVSLALFGAILMVAVDLGMTIL